LSSSVSISSSDRYEPLDFLPPEVLILPGSESRIFSVSSPPPHPPSCSGLRTPDFGRLDLGAGIDGGVLIPEREIPRQSLFLSSFFTFNPRTSSDGSPSPPPPLRVHETYFLVGGYFRVKPLFFFRDLWLPPNWWISPSSPCWRSLPCVFPKPLYILRELRHTLSLRRNGLFPPALVSAAPFHLPLPYPIPACSPAPFFGLFYSLVFPPPYTFFPATP